MAFKKNNPGCPCCCLIFDRDFTPQSEITNNYDGFASPWSYSASAPHLRISGGSGLLTSKVANGSATTTTWIFEIGQISDLSVTPPSGNTYELRVGVKDADNYVFARIKFVSYTPGAFPAFSTHSVQLFERIAGVESAISDEFQYDTDDTYIPNQTFRSFRLCIVQGSGGGYYDDCGQKNELLLTNDIANSDKTPGTQAFAMRGTISDLSVLGGKHAIYISTNTSPDTTAQVYYVAALQHEEDCSQCDCLFCEIGTSPETLRARFVDVDGTHPAWFDSWQTYTRGGYWYNPGLPFTGTFEKWPLTCAYWAEKDTSFDYYGYHPYILLSPDNLTEPIRSSIYWYAWYLGTLVTDYFDGASTIVGASPLDCCEILDGLELDIYHTGNHSYLYASTVISSSGSNTLTVADDWSMVASGRTIKVSDPFGSTTETYTAVSASGSGPTTITVLETIPADRTGWYAIKWATLEIEVVE
jgi:hypothetical protein